ncbi:TRAPP trafficking subunit Trs65-domain-containing protein [Apiospora arundinis]|uniref:TRAPP trafficking subunit Trs65-domain-containing protein n=1 Tax=Apiospora arundinis TaxID=335852 RepID=A0ABR2J5V0_9PEZI
MATVDFIQGATLSYFIPLATDFQLKDALTTPELSLEEKINAIEPRDALFFDETVHVYLSLRSPYVEERTLRSSLNRLVISLEAHIANGSHPDRDSPPAAEVIFSGTLEEGEDPFIIADDEDNTDAGDTRWIYAIYKFPLLLGRPRMRLQGPSVVFTAAASIKPASLGLPVVSTDGYLTSGMAAGLNILESFGHDPELNGVKPRLSALRVSRVAPVTQQTKDLLRPIQVLPKQLALRISPAVHSRIRFARPNTTPPSPAIIAMLEIDFTSFFDCEIALTSISMTVPDGNVEDLTAQSGMALPMSCVAHDHITFLYRIAPEEVETLAKHPMRDLNIEIAATALVQPGICTPKLTMAWTTSLDFTLPLNPGFGSATQPIQRSHRPSQLSINSMTSLVAPAVARPDALPSLEAANKTEMALPDLGITVTFSAPPRTQRIRPGEEFVWTVFVVNRTAAAATAPPRKLALVAIPKRRRNESRVNRPPSLSHVPVGASAHQNKQARDRSVADAVMDENVVHAMQHSSAVDNAEMVCLSADVRVGPLAPGSCHVVELRFMALKSGIVSVDAVRVVDLGSTEHVDIRDLPTVLVDAWDSEPESALPTGDQSVTVEA